MTVALVAALLVIAPEQGSTIGAVSNFTGAGISGPQGITVGPDGALWFANTTNNSIGRITTSGTVTNFTGAGIDEPYGIVAGPDGALWFPNSGNNSIGRITTSGTVTNYTGTGISTPFRITDGPDGALWFTNDGNNSIGRITTSGTVTNYTGTGINRPRGIETGPDGALWFGNSGNNSIGRITTSGTVTNYTGTGISTPLQITSGPDGALWFTNSANASVGRITTAGVVSNYTGAGIIQPRGIVTGPDGTLWFANPDNNSMGRITTAGVVTNFTGTGMNEPRGVTVGPDGAIWFTNEGGNSIGRITTAPGIQTSSVPSGQVTIPYSEPLSAIAGTAPYSWTVFSGALPPGLSLSGAGTISGTPTAAGTYPFVARVVDSDPVSGAATRSLSITVAPAPLSVVTTSVPSGQVLSPYSTSLAATGGTTPYSWSQLSGSLPPGLTLSAAGLISGTSTAAGTYPFEVEVEDSGAPVLSATKSLSIVVGTVPYVLSTTSLVQPTTIAPSGASSWVIDVENTGTVAAPTVEARFDISGSGAFGELSETSVSQGTGCAEDGALRIRCDVGTVPPGQKVSAQVIVVSTGAAGSSIVAQGFASALGGGGTDGTAAPVTISVVAPASLPPGTSSGVAQPGKTFATPGKVTATNPIVVKFKLPKKVAAGSTSSMALSPNRSGTQRFIDGASLVSYTNAPARVAVGGRPAAVGTVKGPAVPMSISRSSAEAGTFCNGVACSGDVIHMTSFSGYNDRKRPAKVTMTWDVTVRGRGTGSAIYKRGDSVTSPLSTLPTCAKTKLGYTNLPCISKRKQLRSGDVQFIVLLLSGDPKFGRR